MDEVDEKSFKNHASTLQTKSLWLAVCFDQYSKEFEDANEAMNHFKSLYPEWYTPFFNYILRATKNVSKKLKTPIRAMYRDDFNNESKLNNLLDIPKNIQEGPETETFVDLPWDLFCQIVFSTFKKLGKIDVALVVLDKYVGSPVKSISSKTKISNTYMKKFYFLSTTNNKLVRINNNPDYDYTLAFLLQTISNSGREPPLILLEACSFNSKKDQIKDWIRGKSKCDLITDRYLIHGFEASTCISFSSSTTTNILSRTRVKYVNFRGKYENVDFPGS